MTPVAYPSVPSQEGHKRPSGGEVTDSEKVAGKEAPPPIHITLAAKWHSVQDAENATTCLQPKCGAVLAAQSHMAMV